jgi:hypothetical protein
MTKSKKRPTIQKSTTDINSDSAVEIEQENEPEPITQNIIPKSKKVKSGKLIKSNTKIINNVVIEPQKTNIILHLKCSLSDLEFYNENYNKQVTNPHTYYPEIPPEVKTYGFDNNYSLVDNIVIDNSDFAYTDSIVNNICKLCNSKIDITLTNDETIIQNEKNSDNDKEDNDKEDNDKEDNDKKEDENDIKDIQFKLKKLKTQLFKNILPSEKKSACFWCTYDFDNTECYIPRYEINGELFGYGCFCRPECAVSFLMKENIDDSTKFERYHLLNQIYSKVFDYKQNIKSAPNPYYMLEKFYGTLTIQEYRKLLNSGHLLLVIDKPMTRILPELHEDNEEIQNGLYSNNIITNLKPIQSKTTGIYIR